MESPCCGSNLGETMDGWECANCHLMYKFGSIAKYRREVEEYRENQGPEPVIQGIRIKRTGGGGTRQ